MKQKIFCLLVLVMTVLTASADAVPTYSLNLANGAEANGTIKFYVGENLTDAVTAAPEGATVTMTITPNDGWVVNTDKVTGLWDAAVTRSNVPMAKDITLNAVADTDVPTYTFTMLRANAEFSCAYKKLMTNSDITIEDIDDLIYTGQALEPTVTVKDGTTELTLSTNYTVSYSNNIVVAAANDETAPTVTITGTGDNYAGTTTVTFNILKANVTLTPPTVAENLVYNAQAQALLNSDGAVDGVGDMTDVKILYSLDQETWAEDISTGTDATDYTVYYKVDGGANHNGVEAASLTATIAPAELTALTLKQTSFVFNQNEKTAEVDAVKAGELTVPGEGYDVYDNKATTAGTYTAKVVGKGNFTGEATAQFTITPAEASQFDITIKPTEVVYNGEPQTPAVTVMDGPTMLTLWNGNDYTLDFSDNVNAGTATVTVTGKGNYSGTKTAEFTIKPAALTGLTLKQTNLVYNQQEQTIEVDAVKAGELTLTAEDYDLTGDKATTVGTYTAKVTGKGNFTGEAEAQWSIVEAGASLFTITLEPTEFTYNGEAQIPAVTVKDGDTTLILWDEEKQTGDYTLAFNNNVNAGTATVTATGKGNYSGTQTAEFTIKPATLSSLTLKQTTLTHNGEELTVEVDAVKAGALTLTADDYELSGNKGTEVGTYTAKVTGKGNFTGEATASWSIESGAPEPIDIEVEVSDAETGEESEVNAKMNITVDPTGEVTEREIIVIDEETGQEVKKTVTVIPVILESIDLTGQEGAGDGQKTELSVTIPKSVLSADGTVLYEVTGIKKDAFKSDDPSVIVTTVILSDNDRLLDIEEGAMNTDDGSVMKIIAPLRLLDDYALMATLKDNFEAEKISTIVTPPNHYWTFSCGVDVLVPEGVGVYTCHVVSDNEVEINQLTAAQLTYNGELTIRHNNGVLIACIDGSDGNAYEIVAKPGDLKSGAKPATGNAKNYPDNQLEPVIENTHYNAGDCYVLNNNAFHAILQSDTKVPACLAVLRKPAAPAAARLSIIEGGDATGISSIENGELRMENVYDLQGRKVVEKTKGIRIMNGKKVIIK